MMQRKKQEYAKTKFSYPSRLVIEKDDNGHETFLEVKRSDPYSTTAEKITK